MACAVILTAIRIEYMAVRAHLSDLSEDIHSQGTIYERGKFSINAQNWEVGIVETGAGNSPAAIEAERAIAHFKPDVILFVGVAGGIKDVQLGDVVAATKVYGYESGKVAETFRPRPNVGLSNYNMIQRAKAEARKTDWLARLSDSAKPNVFVAPIAAGEKVVANKKSDLFEFLQQNYGDALAVEMEGSGILEAVHANQQVSALIIRGISDLIDGKSRADKEGFQELAASHASAFAFQVLAKLWVGQNQWSQVQQEWERKLRDEQEKRQELEGRLSSLQNQKTQAQQEWERQLEWERGKRQEVESQLQRQGQVQPPVREPQSSGDVPLVSAVGVDYTKLRDLLVAKNWKEADLETGKRMLEAAGRESQGWLGVEDVENFPCQDLGTIDKLWVKYSGGKFGFSVQKQIYQDLGGTKDYDKKVWESFGDKVGWRKGGSWLSYSDLTFSEGHYMGHLPSWGGTSPGLVWVGGGWFGTLFSRAETCRL